MKLNNLATKFLGKTNFYYDEIDSTQAKIWRLYRNNTPNGTLVIAGTQTAGIGTHGRQWYTEKNNIAFSFLITMDCNIKKLEGLTLRIAQIILNIFKENYNINLSIKEPNDIVYKNKKVGGILTETKVVKENVKVLVVGIGINTSQKQFPKELKEIATSIYNEFNIDIDVNDFIVEFCKQFEKEFLERIDK